MKAKQGTGIRATALPMVHTQTREATEALAVRVIFLRGACRLDICGGRRAPPSWCACEWLDMKVFLPQPPSLLPRNPTPLSVNADVCGCVQIRALLCVRLFLRQAGLLQRGGARAHARALQL